ncbi:unnamed protein product [Schistosoma rodhaini]|uniref:Uncharacterized protein n=1 Tax=Schistosoma rodhaini TaxID=6188 RepID=A0A183RU99_9TREM|nr:unnamed protein product [Schistosoma rodhaini]
MTGNKLSSSLDEKRGVYVIYSETFCNIHIVALSGVRIRCPLANLDEITPQISDSSNGHLPELSNSDRSDRHFLLACPTGRSGDCSSTQLWVQVQHAVLIILKTNQYQILFLLWEWPLSILHYAIVGI